MDAFDRKRSPDTPALARRAGVRRGERSGSTDGNRVAGDLAGFVAQPLQIRPQLFAADASGRFDRGAVPPSYGPTPAPPLVHKRRIHAEVLCQRRIAARSVGGSIDWGFFAGHVRTVALLLCAMQEPCSIRQPLNAFSIAP